MFVNKRFTYLTCDFRTIAPNSQVNPKPKSNPGRGPIFLGDNCPDTLTLAYLKK